MSSQSQSLGAALGVDRATLASLEQAPPALYPPRLLPKSLKRKPRDNRVLLAAQTIEDHTIFSGFLINDDDNSLNETRFRFRSVIGKQSIYQELDLNATLAPANLIAVVRQKVNNANNNNDSSSQQQQLLQNTRNNYINKNNSNNSSSSTPPPQPSSRSIDILSNADLTLYGTAMASFPLELRRFFYKVIETNHNSPFEHKQSITKGMGWYRHYTNLGPFSPMDKTLPVRYSNQYDKTKAVIFKNAMDELMRTVPIQFNGRYTTRYVNPPANLAARLQRQKQRQAEKLNKMLKKGSSADSDDEEGGKTTKRGRKAVREDGDNDEGENDDDDNDNDEYNSDNDNDSESELDFDMGEVHDDDDDDYGGGASGDDEPTF